MGRELQVVHTPWGHPPYPLQRWTPRGEPGAGRLVGPPSLGALVLVSAAGSYMVLLWGAVLTIYHTQKGVGKVLDGNDRAMEGRE
jgi:hypothetical protein